MKGYELEWEYELEYELEYEYELELLFKVNPLSIRHRSKSKVNIWVLSTVTVVRSAGVTLQKYSVPPLVILTVAISKIKV